MRRHSVSGDVSPVRYVSPPPFRSKEDVDRYLSGERIVCLICGGSYRGVGHHLVRAHGWTIAEYKDRFGIPRSRGLLGKLGREAVSAATRHQHATGTKDDIVRKLKANAGQSSIAAVQAKKAIRASSGRTMARTPRVSIEAVRRSLDDVVMGRTIEAAAKSIGLSRGGLMHYVRRDPELLEKFESIMRSRRGGAG